MAMLEKHRNALDNHFAPQLGEEVTQALMANFPSRDVEEPVTKADLAATQADLREEITGVRLELERFRTDVQRQFNRQFVYLTSVIGVAVGILLRAG